MIRLLVVAVDPETRHLPTALPSDLKSAVLRSWHGLSAASREAAQVMAIGGRPMTSEELDTVLRHAGREPDTAALLGEAASEGITECDLEASRWWFHHPLIPECLKQQLEGGQRKYWHTVFASYGEREADEKSLDDFVALTALAHHHDVAGHATDAYAWTLRAAAAVGEAGGTKEMLHLLQRALVLQQDLGKAGTEREELLKRLRSEAEATGSWEEELEAVEALLAQIDDKEHPLDASALIMRRAQLRFATGREFGHGSPRFRAVRLAGVDKTSWQYAMALTEIAWAGMFEKEGETTGLATDALGIARRAGDPRALSFALTASALGATQAGDIPAALAMANEGLGAATQARDFYAMVNAIYGQANATETWTSQLVAEILHAGRNTISAMRGPHVYIAKIAADEAMSYLAIGRWKECALALRVALGSNPGVVGDGGVRLTAARLAIWQGRQSEAEAHFARAEDLYADSAGINNLEFDAIRAEMFLAAGNPEAAYYAAMNSVYCTLNTPLMREWLLPLAARSLADRIDAARDDGLPIADLLALIDDLLLRSEGMLQPDELDSPFYALQLKAFSLLFQAEIDRARSTAGNGELWALAADAFEISTLRWEETYCCWRAVEALLLRSRSKRGLASTLLLRGLELAEELQAIPLQASLRELAERARITTHVPGIEEPAEETIEVPGLTVREKEILVHVVAGRTYAQIARSLVISEKTVSSHISNMLRKTGTANRLDLARFATRPLHRGGQR